MKTPNVEFRMGWVNPSNPWVMTRTGQVIDLVLPAGYMGHMGHAQANLKKKIFFTQKKIQRFLTRKNKFSSHNSFKKTFIANKTIFTLVKIERYAIHLHELLHTRILIKSSSF